MLPIGAIARATGFRPWVVIAALVLAAVGLAGAAIQTVRLDGFRLGPFAIEGALAKARRLEAERGTIGAMQELAAALAMSAREAAERRYRNLAEEIDREDAVRMPDALAAAERHIAANRLRPAAADCPRSPARAEPGGDRAGRGEAPAQPPQLDAPGSGTAGSERVAVTAEDVRICTANTLQAELARDWVLALEAATREPPPDAQ